MGGVKHPLAFTPTRHFGYFSIEPVCRRIAVITPDPKCRFSGSELLLPSGRRSGVTKAERRKTGRIPNKIFHLTVISPLHPNKINF